MGKAHFVLISTMLLIYQTSLWAASESQLAAVSRAGELNGTALQCSFLEQTQRIKRALVLNLPKQRELGEWFDVNTNLSFMNFISSNSVCPDENSFKAQVGNSIEQLKSAFKQ
ncbi:MAG: hypothetical protein GY820_45220 [Gammaproteobacteria bacterium]|nr:hypothetical protein [Gammaproteobacteria bacterium]